MQIDNFVSILFILTPSGKASYVIKILLEKKWINSLQTVGTAASDLRLHCLPITLLGDLQTKTG